MVALQKRPALKRAWTTFAAIPMYLELLSLLELHVIITMRLQSGAYTKPKFEVRTVRLGVPDLTSTSGRVVFFCPLS